MEIELDLRTEQLNAWRTAAILILILTLVGLGAIGARVTPVAADNSPKLLSWQDWRLLQAERAYRAELAVLQEDAAQLANMLEEHPSPVAAQILAERIARHAKAGDASLAAARETLLMAALNVRDWSAGTLGRDTAVQSVKDAFALLGQ
ncbi:MAG: hypothetical protein JW730_07080 [Anaerolineales bacterium]|nr:hypothetical protein [Anaerolineales bacterium]